MTPNLPRPRPRSMATWLLKEHLDEGLISLDADYQRDVKWDEDKMVALIDSIFENFYIPPLLFAVRHINSRNTRMVIDGKQRLTAINRFMSNEFPYVDPDTGDCKYYSRHAQDKDDRMYLSTDEIETFHQFQFVCVEYNGITVDQEYEIFSRVQLGVAITNQEKLKAHNTPVAKACRDYMLQYNDLKSLISRKTSDASLFQVIAYMYLTLKNGVDNFQSRFSQLLDFVKSTEEPPNRHHETVHRTLKTLYDISQNKNLKDFLVKKNGRLCYLKTLEVLVFMIFRDKVGRPRSTQAYATDFSEMRSFLYSIKTNKLLLGKDTFQKGVVFMDERLERLDLAPARVVIQDLDEDEETNNNDELKQEEYILQEIQTPSPTKRRRNDVRHTARRGGKFNGGLPRS